MARETHPHTPRWRLRSASALAVVLVAGCGLGIDNEARMERAQLAFEEGRFQSAAIDTKNVLLDEPDNLEARLLLGKAQVELGDGAAAERDLRRASELGVEDLPAYLARALLLQGKFDEVLEEMDPELVSSAAVRRDVLRTRGHALIGLRRAEDARQAYTEVLAGDPDDVEAQLGVATSYSIERNFAQARETLNQILTFDPEHVAAWLSSASLALTMRDYERAASDYERAAELAAEAGDGGREMSAWAGFSDAVFLQNQVERARPALERMQALASEDTRTLLVQSRILVNDGEFDAAQGHLQEILRRVPDYRPAQLLLGIVHKENGNLGQAEMYLSAVVSAAPSNIYARRLLAEARLALDKSADARATIESILSESTTDTRSLRIAATASANLGEYDAAVEYLERSVEADPSNVDLQIELATAWLRAGEPEVARQVLESIPESLDPEFAFGRETMLVLASVVEQGVQALPLAEDLVQRWPDRANAHNILGSIRMMDRDLDAARASFEQAASIAPEDLRAQRYLAQVDEMEDDPLAARDRYLAILEQEPADVASMISLARLADEAEDEAATLRWLEQARAADASAVQPRVLLATRLITGGEFTAAADMAREGLAIDNDNAALHQLLGIARIAAGQDDAAEQSLRMAVDLDPANPSYRLQLARLLVRTGDTRGAIAVLEPTQQQGARHLQAGVALAWLHQRNGDPVSAVTVANDLREQYPDDARPFALAAELAAAAGDLGAAATAYERVIELAVEPRYAIRAYQVRARAGLASPEAPLITYLEARPLDPNVRLFLAQAFQRGGRAGAANEQYARVLDLDPNNLIAANNLAWGYFEAGDSRAEAVAVAAYENHPDNSSVVDTLGWILVNQGDLQDGIARLREAQRLNPESGEIRYHLAAALARAGENAEARELLEELLASDAEFSSREEAEALLATF